MKITPLDIYNKEFSKKFSLIGYDGKEVDEFLDHVAAAYERILKELNQLKDENERFKLDLSRYQQMEGTLKETMVVAQETVKERKNQAEREAQMIIENAKTRAREMTTEAKEKVKERMKQYRQIEEYEQFFRLRFKALLDSHQQMLNENKIDKPQGMEILEKELAFSAEEPMEDDVDNWMATKETEESNEI